MNIVLIIVIAVILIFMILGPFILGENVHIIKRKNEAQHEQHPQDNPLIRELLKIDAFTKGASAEQTNVDDKNNATISKKRGIVLSKLVLLFKRGLVKIMSRRQLIILWIGGILIVLMLLFPPRIIKVPYTHPLYLDLGYSFVFLEPKMPSDLKYEDKGWYWYYDPNIDIERLLLPIISVCVVTGLLFLSFKTKK